MLINEMPSTAKEPRQVCQMFLLARSLEVLASWIKTKQNLLFVEMPHILSNRDIFKFMLSNKLMMRQIRRKNNNLRHCYFANEFFERNDEESQDYARRN